MGRAPEEVPVLDDERIVQASWWRATSSWCSVGFWLGTMKRAGSEGIWKKITYVTNDMTTTSKIAQRTRRKRYPSTRAG